MRLGTWLARDIPHTGMASQIDIQGAIHYVNKALPGKRLALHALKNQYGKNIVADSPMFKSYEVKGDKLIISFDSAEGGLLVGQAIEKDLLDAPAVLENSEDKVKLFYLAGEDRVWHPATMKIDGDKVVVSSPGVKAPRGVSYGAEGIGSQPNVYNKAMLPLVPFMYFDNKLVTSKDWPGGKIVIADEKIDTSMDGKVYEYRKMPLLSQQFDDNAVLQAGKPVTIWGSTRNFGEWQAEPEKGDCKVEFEFGDIKKTIAVTPDMAEWQVTLPPMKAGTTPFTLKVSFTINGETVHQREAKNIVFGDVWYLALPAGQFTAPEVKPSGQIVRMIENESKRDGHGMPSRFSIATSRGLRAENRFASYWKDAEGLAAAFGHGIAAKTKNPVGIIFMQGKTDMALKNWIAADFLNQAPSLMADYKTVGSQHTDNPHYLENIRRYIADWQKYWDTYIPAMIETKAAPDGAQWGVFPTLAPEIGDSQATMTYNVYVDCFSPGQVSGVVFLCGNKMISDAQGANFGPEMSALANCFKAKFGGDDVPFFYTIPTAALAPKITKPQAIKGASTATGYQRMVRRQTGQQAQRQSGTGRRQRENRRAVGKGRPGSVRGKIREITIIHKLPFMKYISRTTLTIALMAACSPAGAAETASPAFESTYYKDWPLFSTYAKETERTQPIEHFGPVGIGIELLLPPFQMKLSRIDKGSPAEATGKLKVGQMIESINGQTLKDIDPRIILGGIITKAEATDGIVKFMVKEKPDAKAEEVVVKIPVLGAYSKTWPLNCPKSDKIVRGQADFLARSANMPTALKASVCSSCSRPARRRTSMSPAAGSRKWWRNTRTSNKIETIPVVCRLWRHRALRILPAHRRCLDHSPHRDECRLPPAQHVQRRLEPKGRSEFRLWPPERGRRPVHDLPAPGAGVRCEGGRIHAADCIEALLPLRRSRQRGLRRCPARNRLRGQRQDRQARVPDGGGGGLTPEGEKSVYAKARDISAVKRFLFHLVDVARPHRRRHRRNLAQRSHGAHA